MLNLSQEYSKKRLAVWTDETRSLKRSLESGLSEEWQDSLGEMSGMAQSRFQEMAADGQAAAGLVSQSWDQALTGLTTGVDNRGEFLQTIQKVATAWMGSIGGGAPEAAAAPAASSAWWATSWISAACSTRAAW